MMWRAFLLLAALIAAYFAVRMPVTTTMVTDHGHLIFVQMRFESSCMRVVAALERKVPMLAVDPWGAEHVIVAASCERGDDNIGWSILEKATVEQ